MNRKSLTKRQKMVLSGDLFELIVASKIQSLFDYPILIKREFYDDRIHKSMECDLILVTPFKIYCIECKSYNGYVSGSKFETNWRFASSGRKSTVQNPYLLNKIRIRLIRGLFYNRDFNPPKVENLIVVPDYCNIHVGYDKIYNLTDFLNLIKIDSVTHKSIYKEHELSKFLFDNSSKRRS